MSRKSRTKHPTKRHAGDLAAPPPETGRIPGWLEEPHGPADDEQSEVTHALDALMGVSTRPVRSSARSKPPVAEHNARSRAKATVERIRGYFESVMGRRATAEDKLWVLRQLAEKYESQASPPPLPTAAPELWSDRKDRMENPPVFIRRVYGAWIGKGLTRPHLRQLDYPLYKALGVWAHRHPDDAMPELPTLSEWIDQQVEQLSGRYSADDLRKLGLALQQRHRKGK